MIFGFTGNRYGLSETQIKEILKIFENEEGKIEVHHGDCVGADEQFHKLCEKNTKIKIVIHPPSDNKLRAFCKSDYITEPKDYLKRNDDILKSCEILIACPIDENEILRSGTWSTIRKARKSKKDIRILV
jgi:hypothetical protein